MKWIVLLICWSLRTEYSCFAQDIFQCPLCGEGKEVTNPGGIVSIPQNGDFECQTLLNFAQQGGIDQQTCAFVETFVQTPCGCRTPLGADETSAPTEIPTTAPSLGPAPDCYDDLNNILQREAALTQAEIQIGRTYVLCRNTVFFMGRLNPSGGFENGFDAITPRPNVHYKCGKNGSSSNNCRLLDGTFPIISFGGDPEHSNVTFQGLTIESAANGGVLAGRPGDLNFVDCIFKNHENIGPVHILFDSPLVRRLSRRGRELSNADLPELLESYDEERDRGVWNSENRTIDAEGRQLQGSGALTTLTLSFKRCIFEGNKLVGNFANTGMIQSVTAETILLFEDVIFRNNDYGDNTLKASASAILSRGPLTIKDSCFIDNSFVRDAPVIAFREVELNVRNNFLNPVDDNLACSFVATYSDQSAWEAGSISNCIIAEADSCQSDIPPVSVPQPTPVADQPTRIPVPRVTLAPAVPPTSSPTMPLPQRSSALQVRFSLYEAILLMTFSLYFM